MRSLRQQLQRRQAEYAAGELDDRLRTVDVQRYQQAQTELRERIGGLEEELAGAKERRREVPKRIAMSELPAEQRIKRLLPGRKQLMDTIKMIAYRAETGLCGLLRGDDVFRAGLPEQLRRPVWNCPRSSAPMWNSPMMIGLSTPSGITTSSSVNL